MFKINFINYATQIREIRLIREIRVKQINFIIYPAQIREIRLIREIRVSFGIYRFNIYKFINPERT